MPRIDEEFARESFDRFLAGVTTESRSWSPGAQPPDFDLTLGFATHPVEVTQLMESVSIDQQVATERGWVKNLESVSEKVEAEMQRRNVLRGTFVLDLEPAVRSHQLAAALFDAIEAYIRQTADRDRAPRHVLWRGPEGASWSIEKIHANGNLIGAGMSIGGAKRHHEIRADLRQMITNGLEGKRHKTRSLRNVVLLFVDAYNYGDSTDWAFVAAELSFEPFHTVARVHQEWQCQVLCSTEPTWRAV